MDTESGLSERPREEDGSEKERLPTIGEVTKVWTRTTTDDTGPDSFSNHEASVKLQTEQEEPRRFPIHQSFPGTAGVPIPGDFVVVEYINSQGESPAITGYAYNTDNRRPPLARQGHWRREFGSLYLEAEKTDHSELTSRDEYDVVRIAKKPDGLSDPTTEVAIDDSGSSTQISIDTDGDITLSADGDIVIDEGGTAAPVAVQDHTHPESGGGTTGTPNESGTNVEIE